jgi:hypothetical protein
MNDLARFVARLRADHSPGLDCRLDPKSPALRLPVGGAHGGNHVLDLFQARDRHDQVDA